MELGGSALILLGLAARPTILALLGMLLAIQTFIYPVAWPDHIQWLAFLLIPPARGPDGISLDAMIERRRQAL